MEVGNGGSVLDEKKMRKRGPLYRGRTPLLQVISRELCRRERRSLGRKDERSLGRKDEGRRRSWAELVH